MERTRIYFALNLSLALLFFLASPTWAQIDIGDFSISGQAEVGGLPRHKDGKDTKFEEYRDLPETVIVPQLQLMIGGKKEDFYLNFDSTKTGLADQNYRLRFGRYGLVDVEFEWDQIPHLFSSNTARTPFARDGGGGTFTLASKPLTTAGTSVRNWVNANAQPLDLKLFDGIGRFKLRYTPTPGWTFTGSYWSYDVSGKRALGAYIGSSPGNFNIIEQTEPISYLTHNIELGGEYAGNGWSLGLRYNASLFHNNISTLVWDNPINLSGIGSACTDAANYSNTSTGTGLDPNRGPCRGRMDLYPSNQAHTWTLTGTATLPLKSQFLGTVSYGFRRQDDSFLPFTINSAITQPSLPRSSLDGDVRPTMVNATVVNRYFDRLDLKAYYRYYDFDNRSRKVLFSDGIVLSDQAGTAAIPTCNPTCPEAGSRTFPYSYSKQNIGLDGGYNFTRWLTGKLGYGWERMHRDRREVLNADEHSVGPTFDIKPNSWVLFRASYRHFWRNAPNYDAGRFVVVDTGDTPDDVRADHNAALRKYDEAQRHRDKSSLFAQISPWDRLTLYTGLEVMSDRFPSTDIGVKNDFNYSPSIGFVYTPSDWMSLFADYNWERFDWKMTSMQRTAANEPFVPGSNRIWDSRGRDQVNTISLGSDMNLIKNLLGFRIQYGFSLGREEIHASGATCVGCTAATNLPRATSQWHELLARFEYQVHKNVALRFGYYFNHYTEQDAGVDMMQPWMGAQNLTDANLGHSIFLGDRIKAPFTAHVGFMTLRLSF